MVYQHPHTKAPYVTKQRVFQECLAIPSCNIDPELVLLTQLYVSLHEI